MGDELDKTPGAGLKRLSCWSDNFEVDCRRCPGSNGVDFPRGSLTDTNFCLSNASRFLASRNSMPDQSRDLEFFRRLKTCKQAFGRKKHPNYRPEHRKLR